MELTEARQDKRVEEPLGPMKECSSPRPTGVAGSDRDAWTAESILSRSRVGELGADILSVVLSRTASSCLRSVGGDGR